MKALALSLLFWVVAPPALAQSAAQVDYMLNCQGCHLPDATGREPYVPNLVGQLGRYVAVAEGRAYVVQVPGTAHAPLTDAEIARLLNWMVDNFSPATRPADFRPFSAAEVAGYRAERPLDIMTRRRHVLALSNNKVRPTAAQ